MKQASEKAESCRYEMYSAIVLLGRERKPIPRLKKLVRVPLEASVVPLLQWQSGC
jgi:hypothetical protein